MNIAMLWYDPDPASDLAGKVRKAAEYYRRKYGTTPNCCVVNPCMTAQPVTVDQVEVETSRFILKNNFWIGVTTGDKPPIIGTGDPAR